MAKKIATKNHKVSVIIPFLNEERSIGRCIRKVHAVFKKNNIDGEIIAVDSDSTDNSAKVAKSLGAVIVNQPLRGYGNALRKGFEEAKGGIIVMGDADDTYDFEEMPKILDPIINERCDIVNGNRFEGKLMPGAMSLSHIIGNKILTMFVTLFFGKYSSDPYSGYKALTREALEKMELKSGNWELNSEMILKGKKAKLKIKEVPIHYYPREGESKLSGIDAAWKNIKFMLLNSPNHVFLIPGITLMLIAIITFALLFFRGLEIGTIKLSYLSLLLSGLVIIIGFQIFSLGFVGKIFLERKGANNYIRKILTLERGLLLGLVLLLSGVSLGIFIFYKWINTGFSVLGFENLAIGILSFILTSMGIQIIFTSFLMTMIKIEI